MTEKTLIHEAATRIIERALRNGRERAVYLMPNGRIEDYVNDGALIIRITSRHDSCLVGVYNAYASVQDVVDDILEGLKR